MTNKTKETTFWAQLKKFGIMRFLVSLDFIASLALFLSMALSKEYDLNYFFIADNNYVIGIIAAASTLFAITLAALALILSFSSSSFVAFLKEKGRFSNLLFNFWIGNAAYLVVIFCSFVYLIIGDHIQFGVILRDWLYIIISSVFLYSLIETFYLLSLVVRFGFFLDLFEGTGKKK